MRARSPLLLALAALAAAPAARAEVPRGTGAGPLFALRAGVGFPRGEIRRDGPDVRDYVERKIPLGLELGYRFGERIWGEFFFELAPASAASSLCAAGVECYASDARLGVAVLLRLAPRWRVDPWVGLGVGVEVLNAKGWNASAAPPAHYEWSWAGVELPFVETGFDLAVSQRVGVGPWASLTIARFTSESSEKDDGGTVTHKIQDRAYHGWISGGLKATLKL
jgi:hypothetical protein